MTLLQAIKSRVNYPMTDLQAMEKLEGRGLVATDAYSEEVAMSKPFKLAYADTLRFVVTMVNLSQGGSITAQNVAAIRDLANSIYKEYDEPLMDDAAKPYVEILS